MKIRDGYLLKKVAGNFVVVPVENLDFDGLVHLNETGAVLWKKLESECSFEDLVTELLNKYEIDIDVAKRDVVAFLDVLRKESLIYE